MGEIIFYVITPNETPTITTLFKQILVVVINTDNTVYRFIVFIFSLSLSHFLSLSSSPLVFVWLLNSFVVYMLGFVFLHCWCCYYCCFSDLYSFVLGMYPDPVTFFIIIIVFLYACVCMWIRCYCYYYFFVFNNAIVVVFFFCIEILIKNAFFVCYTPPSLTNSKCVTIWPFWLIDVF